MRRGLSSSGEGGTFLALARQLTSYASEGAGLPRRPQKLPVAFLLCRAVPGEKRGRR
jgi:hypothetical protein